MKSIERSKTENKSNMSGQEAKIRPLDTESMLLKGQVEIWQLMFGFANSMALKCVVELGIPDIINSHGAPITLSQIASGIKSPNPNMAYLTRIMRYLVRKEIFTIHHPLDGSETLYGLNQISKWLLSDSELTLTPMVVMQNHPWQLAPWHYLGQCVKEGGIAFKKAHGQEIFDFASKNLEFNRIFNEAMACMAKTVMKAFLETYKGGFDNVRSVVDVGGGTGGYLAEIVKAYPHIRGINFDLPHVAATAPAIDRVSHVGGNMFEAIPNADVVFMKWILHDWRDEDCVKILQNCRKAISERTGKLILVEIVLQLDRSSNQFHDMGFIFDLLMIAHTTGKERTELEWKELLEEGGFSRYKIINIPALPSIIEAYLE